MPTPSPALDPTVTDILIPSAAILVSAMIAFVVIGIQLAASKRERRSEAIGRVAAAISHITAEGTRKRTGENVDFEPAMASFDATLIELTLAVRKRDRLAVSYFRDRMYTEFLSPQPVMDVIGGQLRSDLESWALGHIPNREFRAYAAWRGHGPTKQRFLYQAWDDLRRELADDPYISAEELAVLDRRQRKHSTGYLFRLRNWWDQQFFRIYRR